MKVWITKYALSRGIIEADGALLSGGDAYVKFPGSNYEHYLRAIDVHPSQELAARRAGQMRDAKITSLQRQIRKLRGMEFKP